MDAATVEGHIAAQTRLRELTVQAVANAWARLGSYDEDDVAPWLAYVLPLLLAAQRFAVGLTDAYVARMLDRRPLGLDPTPVVGAVRGPVAPVEVYRRPFVTVWSELAARTPYEDAVRLGGVKAETLMATDLQLARRGALQAVQDGDRRIRGWQRVANPGACPYCQLLNGVKVRRADALAIHPACLCDLRPSLEPVDPDPLPDGVVVGVHGEYGAAIVH